MSLRTSLLGVLLLLLVGCGLAPTGPVAPTPLPPPVVVTPPDISTLVTVGEPVATVLERLKSPVEDPPENPGMPDWKAWTVRINDKVRAVWVEFRDGLVWSAQYRDVIDATR